MSVIQDQRSAAEQTEAPAPAPTPAVPLTNTTAGDAAGYRKVKGNPLVEQFQESMDSQTLVRVRQREAMAEDAHVARIRGEAVTPLGKRAQEIPAGMDPRSIDSREDVIAGAAASNPLLHNVSQELAARCPGATAPGEQIKLKGAARMNEKVGKYDGLFTMFTDVARSSLVFDTPRNLIEGAVNIRHVLGTYDIKVVALKNRFTKKAEAESASGYMDILVNLLIPLEGGKVHNTELQLHLKKMHDAKGDKVDINDGALRELKDSARTLLGLHNNTTAASDFQFNDKAKEKIDALLSEKTSDQISGHDLYHVSRYLNENHEKLGGSMMGVNLQAQGALWDRIAKEQLYGPPAAELKDDKDMAALRALSHL